MFSYRILQFFLEGSHGFSQPGYPKILVKESFFLVILLLKRNSPMNLFWKTAKSDGEFAKWFTWEPVRKYEKSYLVHLVSSCLKIESIDYKFDKFCKIHFTARGVQNIQVLYKLAILAQYSITMPHEKALKKSENLMFFWLFQGVWKWNIGIKGLNDPKMPKYLSTCL